MSSYLPASSATILSSFFSFMSLSFCPVHIMSRVCSCDSPCLRQSVCFLAWNANSSSYTAIANFNGWRKKWRIRTDADWHRPAWWAVKKRQSRLRHCTWKCEVVRELFSSQIIQQSADDIHCPNLCTCKWLVRLERVPSLIDEESRLHRYRKELLVCT